MMHETEDQEEEHDTETAIKRIMFSKPLQRVALSKCDNCRRRHNYQYGLEDPVFSIQFEQCPRHANSAVQT